MSLRFAPKAPKKFNVSLLAARFQEGSVGTWLKRAMRRVKEKRKKLSPKSSESRTRKKEKNTFLERAIVIYEEVHDFLKLVKKKEEMLGTSSFLTT